MKKADQVREFVRRRCLEEREVQLDKRNSDFNGGFWTRSYARVRELAFIEVLNAFDTPHKTKLDMPKEPKRYRIL